MAHIEPICVADSMPTGRYSDHNSWRFKTLDKQAKPMNSDQFPDTGKMVQHPKAEPMTEQLIKKGFVCECCGSPFATEEQAMSPIDNMCWDCYTNN